MGSRNSFTNYPCDFFSFKLFNYFCKCAIGLLLNLRFTKTGRNLKKCTAFAEQFNAFTLYTFFLTCQLNKNVLVNVVLILVNIVLPWQFNTGTFSSPESSFPLTSGRKTRALGATISGMCHRCRLRSETRWAEFSYFLEDRRLWGREWLFPGGS